MLPFWNFTFVKKLYLIKKVAKTHNSHVVVQTMSFCICFSCWCSFSGTW